MMLNEANLIGRLGQDPSIRGTQDNQVCSFSLATSEFWYDKGTGERKERTEWHKIVIFNQKLIEIAKEFLETGALVYIKGSLAKHKWTDANGIERYELQVVLKNYNSAIRLLNRKLDSPKEESAFLEGNAEPDEDIPF